MKVLRLADETPSRRGANIRSSVFATMQLVYGDRHSITLEFVVIGFFGGTNNVISAESTI